MNITRAQLKAAIDAAHKRGIKVTGHLCSVTYTEAAELGIDDLEHGFFVNTQLDPEKKPDQCSASMGDFTLEHMDPTGPEAKALIAVRDAAASGAKLAGVTIDYPLEGSVFPPDFAPPTILWHDGSKKADRCPSLGATGPGIRKLPCARRKRQCF
jgi:hypothetical protein